MDQDIEPPAEVPSWDEVDEASWESFPASDPPSWNHHRVIGCPEDKLPDRPRKPQTAETVSDPGGSGR